MIVKGKEVKRNGRSCASCECDLCKEAFIRRLDYSSFEFCKACSNRLAGKKRMTHGFNNKNSRIYVIWANMKRRCFSPTEKEKRNYKGISLCEDWLSFEVFMGWALSNGYSKTKSIDRLDNNLGYTPENCRFTDISTQNANKRITDKNTSGYIGVSFEKGKYVAYVNWKKRKNNLGRYSDPLIAAKVRDKFVIDNNLPHTLNFSKVKEIENNRLQET